MTQYTDYRPATISIVGVHLTLALVRTLIKKGALTTEEAGDILEEVRSELADAILTPAVAEALEMLKLVRAQIDTASKDL